MNTARKSTYPSNVTDEQCEFLLLYLTLMTEEAPQREYSLREVFNAIRYGVRTGVQWRYLPNDFPPWTAVYQQARRWLHSEVFKAIAHDLRIIERLLKERDEEPSAVILDARTRQSTPQSGSRAGYDWAKKKTGLEGACGGRYAGNGLRFFEISARFPDQWTWLYESFFDLDFRMSHIIRLVAHFVSRFG